MDAAFRGWRQNVVRTLTLTATARTAPIQLSDGRILYPGKELWTEDKRTGVWESKDDGKNVAASGRFSGAAGRDAH